MDFDWALFVSLILLWLVAGPVLTMIHELGHALAALLVSRGSVEVWLGASPSPHALRLGRLRISLRPFTGYVGFCDYADRELSRSREAIIMLAGQLASLLTAAACFIFLRSYVGEPAWLGRMLAFTAWGALIQFLVTAVPMRYARWFDAAYRGLASDGAKLLAFYPEPTTGG